MADHREREANVKLLDALEERDLLVRQPDRERANVVLEVGDLAAADEREDVCERGETVSKASATNRKLRRDKQGALLMTSADGDRWVSVEDDEQAQCERTHRQWRWP